MKVIQSSLFRALCAIIIGALLIQYREQTVTWITIAIGVLFFLSGVFSLLSYMSAKRSAEKMKGQYLYDAQGNHIIGMRPNFPLVGLGSLIFGLVLGTDAKCIHCLADVHSLGNTDYGRSNPNGYSGICCQDGQSGHCILADAYTPAAVGSVHPLQAIFHCLCPTARYRMGNAGIWRSRSRQRHEGFQQPTQMA